MCDSTIEKENKKVQQQHQQHQQQDSCVFMYVWQRKIGKAIKINYESFDEYGLKCAKIV